MSTSSDASEEGGGDERREDFLHQQGAPLLPTDSRYWLEIAIATQGQPLPPNAPSRTATPKRVKETR